MPNEEESIDPSAAARALAKIKSPKRLQESRRTIAIARQHIKNPGRKPWPLSRYECTCGRGDSLEGHPWSCPRGQAIRRRIKKGYPLE